MSKAWFSHAFSDVIRFAKSRPVMVSASFTNITVDLIRVPKYAFVTGLRVLITTPLSGGTPSLTIGYSGNGATAVTDGFMISSVVIPGTAGMKNMKDGVISTAPGSQGKYFSGGAGVVTATLSGTPTAGVFYVFVDYRVIY